MATEPEPWQPQTVTNKSHGAMNEPGKHHQTLERYTDPKMLTLSPSPMLLEPCKAAKDDSALSTPTTPRRPNVSRGLSLQLPKQDVTSPSAAKLTHNLMIPAPLSPQLDPSTSFGSTISPSVLPRRSRGLDFSRACTHLHHSTLADQSSPDSSPVIGGKGVNIPRRGGSGADSPMYAGNLWSTMSSEKVMSSSMGSVNMMESGESTDSDEDMLRGGEEEDTIHMTPQPYRASFSVFSQAAAPSPGFDPLNSFSPTAVNLMSFKRRSRSSRTRDMRKGSSSTSLQSSLPSPGPLSPPLRSVEHSGNNYFAKDIEQKSVESRRESLSLGTNELRISDTVDGDGRLARNGSYDALGLPNPQVVRRAVTRRSNMLPKPKTFARIRAALREEISPVDTECRREAEVIRQVRESEPSPAEHNAGSLQSMTGASFPAPAEALEELSEIINKNTSRHPSSTFTQQAVKNSGGSEFWNNFDERIRTPPPPFPLRTNSTISDDIAMETPTSTTAPSVPLFPAGAYNSSPSRSATPQPAATVGEYTRKTLGKRRRDDDFDPALFKRRAVSPGLSLQNSPLLPPSPAQREGAWWQTKAHRESSASSNSNSISNGTVGKRIGMQGMNDTHDSLMNMSIE